MIDQKQALKIARKYLHVDTFYKLSPLYTLKNLRAEKPILIHSPEGNPTSWFIGITSGDRFVGFIQVNLTGTVEHLTSFMHADRSLNSCPSVDQWLDKETIMKAALQELKNLKNVELSEPILSYDSVPSKIAWVIRVRRSGRVIRQIFVVGSYTYSKLGDSDSVAYATGGPPF